LDGNQKAEMKATFIEISGNQMLQKEILNNDSIIPSYNS
jgi:hypothetical protein